MIREEGRAVVGRKGGGREKRMEGEGGGGGQEWRNLE